jgi:hypothetical protein
MDKSLLLRLAADGSTRTLSFPGWRSVGSTAPANIAASKVALLRLACFGTGDGAVFPRILTVFFSAPALKFRSPFFAFGIRNAKARLC